MTAIVARPPLSENVCRVSPFEAAAGAATAVVGPFVVAVLAVVGPYAVVGPCAVAGFFAVVGFFAVADVVTGLGRSPMTRGGRGETGSAFRVRPSVEAALPVRRAVGADPFTAGVAFAWAFEASGEAGPPVTNPVGGGPGEMGPGEMGPGEAGNGEGVPDPAAATTGARGASSRIVLYSTSRTPSQDTPTASAVAPHQASA
ncbi:hypothetical protein [Sphaerimonospora thailandensis]|uniref:hypothetical protein n=1 Tax=Sphaerimonospora thailandensis TaxID=795644 RepID=UPI00194E8251|nr:hypothetical protein [Sphaerimonospora thailandensis]